ncbi:hypothetical protein VXL47_12115 [Phaeobacter sp. JH20_30]|uniref:hypothetical protein n=1 Tax=unclassified Phaeobacter TaxID=2621772 RepID=UPI003A8A29B9
MMRWVSIGALCLAVMLAGVSSYLVWRNGHLREDLDAANIRLSVKARQLENAQQDKAVLKAHVKRLQADQYGVEAEIRNLWEKEGSDAPLSDYLGDVFDRL